MTGLLLEEMRGLVFILLDGSWFMFFLAVVMHGFGVAHFIFIHFLSVFIFYTMNQLQLVWRPEGG